MRQCDSATTRQRGKQPVRSQAGIIYWLRLGHPEAGASQRLVVHWARRFCFGGRGK